VLTVLVILAVLGILFGAAALATYEGDVLQDPRPDDRHAGLPPASLQPEDVAELRFDMALRGYRMNEVDLALERLATELSARDARIQELELALVESVEPAPVEPPPLEEPPPAAPETFEPFEPAAVAPAAISGPLTGTTWWTAPVPEPEQEPVAAVDVDPPVAPEPEPEPEAEVAALTLPAGDDAFSFPELHPPEPAVAEDEPEREPEPRQDWWSSQDEPPAGG
jgi:DivIVA domain-containing protein